MLRARKCMYKPANINVNLYEYVLYVSIYNIYKYITSHKNVSHRPILNFFFSFCIASYLDRNVSFPCVESSGLAQQASWLCRRGGRGLKRASSGASGSSLITDDEGLALQDKQTNRQKATKDKRTFSEKSGAKVNAALRQFDFIHSAFMKQKGHEKLTSVAFGDWSFDKDELFMSNFCIL